MAQISLFEGGEKLTVKKPVRLIELFGGIGAQASALEAMGIQFEHYRMCDFEPHAVQSYNSIHYTDYKPMDILEMKGADLGITEKDKYTYILTYSFPCTDLSLAGKREGMVEGSGTSSSLLWEVKRLLVETNELPDILLMENVPAVIHEGNLPEFNRWVMFLESIGYISKYECLNAKNYGVPQNRDRCYMVSWLDNTEIGGATLF